MENTVDKKAGDLKQAGGETSAWGCGNFPGQMERVLGSKRMIQNLGQGKRRGGRKK